MATVLELQPPPPLPAAAQRLTTPFPSPSHWLTSVANSRGRVHSLSCKAQTVRLMHYMGGRYNGKLEQFELNVVWDGNKMEKRKWNFEKVMSSMALHYGRFMFNKLAFLVHLPASAWSYPICTGFSQEYINTFDGYSFQYPQNWIQVRGAGADVFFRDPFVLDENLYLEISSPSSSKYICVEDLGSPQ
ncbi:photosystem II reaction center PsbP family protein [Actinidia rufa]|uniref:Photosystem II reaction center PsbP family protein n=1 Tax=Actinidia rufa TaxID=165716 RepID=A0A7J0ERG9_9ERIC|nr:photosystem II reaction center PsbP family protein [Actinidia rufa]